MISLFTALNKIFSMGLVTTCCY